MKSILGIAVGTVCGSPTTKEIEVAEALHSQLAAAHSAFATGNRAFDPTQDGFAVLLVKHVTLREPGLSVRVAIDRIIREKVLRLESELVFAEYRLQNERETILPAFVRDFGRAKRLQRLLISLGNLRGVVDS